DFYSRLTQESPDIAQLLDHGVANIVPRLSRAAILRIINEPAAAMGYPIEAGLAERIADDAMRFDPLPGVEGTFARSTVLPFLEFVLDRLFENRRDGVLVNREYPEHGLTSTLAQWASDRFHSLHPSLQPRAQRLLTELIHIEDEDE